jgi:hypothetical protein
MKISLEKAVELGLLTKEEAEQGYILIPANLWDQERWGPLSQEELEKEGGWDGVSPYGQLKMQKFNIRGVHTSEEFLQDRVAIDAYVDKCRTAELEDEEIKEWKKVDQLLDKIDNAESYRKIVEKYDIWLIEPNAIPLGKVRPFGLTREEANSCWTNVSPWKEPTSEWE